MKGSITMAPKLSIQVKKVEISVDFSWKTWKKKKSYDIAVTSDKKAPKCKMCILLWVLESTTVNDSNQ